MIGFHLAKTSNYVIIFINISDVEKNGKKDYKKIGTLYRITAM